MMEKTEPQNNLKGMHVLLRSAGEMATGVAYRLAKSGFKVLMTEIENPLAVRRAVSFCESVYDQSKTVENMTAQLAKDINHALEILESGDLPVLIDPKMKCLDIFKPKVIIDAILAKKNTGLSKDMAPLTIGLGPGFIAPQDVHLAIETNRGHNLGRLIYDGTPEANTSVPGEMAGYTYQRVLRAPADGIFETKCQLGDRVEKDQVLAIVNQVELKAQVGGIIRGLLRPNTPVHTGLKVGDVDPRGKIEYLNTISEKARALGGSCLEGILQVFNK